MSLLEPSIRDRVTPRAIAWVILLGGVVGFVLISPKTPLQFFDAANRDESVIDTLTKPRSERFNYQRERTLETLRSMDREMIRMTLSHDVTHDPARIQQERTSILLGFYDASPRTRAAMTQNNRNYQSMAGQFDKLKTDLKASRESQSISPVSQVDHEEDKNLRMKRFQAVMDRMTLRQFQARLFWRAHP